MLGKALMALVITLVINSVMSNHAPVEVIAMLTFVILVMLFAPKADETFFDRHYARYTSWKAEREASLTPVETEAWHARIRRMLSLKKKLAQKVERVQRSSTTSRTAQPRRSDKKPDGWVDPYLGILGGDDDTPREKKKAA